MIGITILMMVTPLAAASPHTMSAVKAGVKQVRASQEDFTHTVMVEYGTMTTCPYCVIASSQLYSIYNSGDLDFYYVSLVYDKGNANVRDRLQELGVSSVPDVYFDGGYKRSLGAQSSEQAYRNAITQCGIRDVPDIVVDANVEWKGGGTLKITVTVQNNEPEEYNGHLRVYIVEKESRWNDNGGHPYHFGVLDIPIDRSLPVSQSQQQGQPSPLGGTYTFRKTWFGALYGFGDITKDNTMVIASVFDPDSNYAVQTDAAEPTGSGSGSFVTTFSQIQQAIFSSVKTPRITVR
jgi:glutaredoxin